MYNTVNLRENFLNIYDASIINLSKEIFQVIWAKASLVEKMVYSPGKCCNYL